MPPAVEFTAVNKNFGSYRALADISLTIPEGQRVIVCGPSGSGKSTLIRCISGLESFDEGSLRVGGKELPAKSPRPVASEGVGMVFQQFNLFPHLSVLENCTLAPIHTLKMPRAAAEEVAMPLLRRVRIAEHAHKYPAQISGGQQQRVAIARALCMSPRILLFDEPTSALDPEMVREVLDVMLDLAASGITMICVTHEMGFARKAADRVLFMDEGRIVEDASPDAFFDRPQHDRSRQFLAQVLHH